MSSALACNPHSAQYDAEGLQGGPGPLEQRDDHPLALQRQGQSPL